MPRPAVPPAQDVRALIQDVSSWITDKSAAPSPARTDPLHPRVAQAVRASARTLERMAPGHTVEVRIPPFVAIQCVQGPRHTRGTPPNVVQMSPHAWLRLVTGVDTWEECCQRGDVTASGVRAEEIARWCPFIGL